MRNASDQFFEWQAPLAPTVAADGTPVSTNGKVVVAPQPVAKRRPKALIYAVQLLAADRQDGRIGLGALGQYLKRTDPAFSPKVYGHSSLSDMVRAYPDLVMTQENGTGFWVGLKPRADGVAM